ncbi:MAG TPA: M48 family metalloprotease [Alphaproteobacteria bacterium]|nr:M48 family metalloprotease [Alphaproteobacteria bacterium]
MIRRMYSRLASAVLAWSLLTSPVLAQRISFIRDAEIENTIRAYAAPVFTAAGLNANDIGVHIINDRSLNAFVANGLNLYINSGTLLQADSPLQVIGVMAHETGHIAGGHLARFRDSMQGAMEQSIVAMVLGAAIMAAGGRSGGQAGAGVMSAGTQVGVRSFLQYSREMESQADQAGCNFLERAGLSARGLADFLQKIEGEELLEPSQQDPYVRTHPITSERVDFVRNFVAHQAHGKADVSPQLWDMHRRMQAKLLGYLDPSRTLQAYKPGTFKCSLPTALVNPTDASNKFTVCTDADVKSVARAAQYGRAIAYAQQTHFAQGLAEMDGLLQDQPNDPYYLEEKAQILFDSGKVADSVPLYGQAVSLRPNEPLIRVELAQAQLGTDRADLLPDAIKNLEQVKQQTPENGDAWRLLAIAYGRDGQLGLAALSQAELESLRGQRAAARTFAERAQKQLKPGSAAWLRADDIKNANPPDKEK